MVGTPPALNIDRDMILLSGRFMDEPLPKEKEYLYKYFDTTIQQLFAKYYFEFGSIKYFVAHTGIYCDPRWLQRLKSKFQVIEKAYEEAKAKGDFEKIAEIKEGNLPIPYRETHRARDARRALER